VQSGGPKTIWLRLNRFNNIYRYFISHDVSEFFELHIAVNMAPVVNENQQTIIHPWLWRGTE
jgi:hypothetical protein